ncbi:MAG TPA: AAA family ATPase [Dehalococcoidia bacterium]|nr:AAA family ATPase [Dehalococcoidia bacterium]
MFGPDPGTAAAIGTGRREIDRYLEGIGLGSLLLVEGKHASGKSVLCQHLAHHALGAGLGVAYYTSEEPSPSLLTRTAALGLDMLDHFLLDRLRIHPLETADAGLGPAPLLDRLARHVEDLPPEFQLVVVDSLTALLPPWSRGPLLDFIEAVNANLEHCRRGRTVVLVLDSGPALEWVTARLSQEPEARLRLRLAAVAMGRTLRTLEVLRRDQHPEWPSPPVAFQVEAGWGIRVIPWRQFRVPSGAWQDAGDLL